MRPTELELHDRADDVDIARDHIRGQRAAEAAQAVGAQGAFWTMNDLLINAETLGLEVARLPGELLVQAHAARVAQDVGCAYARDVPGTPTFFFNGRWHGGVDDVESVGAAVQAARRRWAR